MFERYTERARRVIFFARYECSQFGSTVIESEHLLLGVLREDKNLLTRFVATDASAENIYDEVTARLPVRPRLSTAVDLPLSSECSNILRFAVEEADRLNHHHVGVEHLVLGILHEGNCVAAEVLKKYGLELGGVREKLADRKSEDGSATDRQFSYSPDDAKKAMTKRLLFTIAYRFERTLDGAPPQFENFRPAPNEKTPHETISRMTMMIAAARGLGNPPQSSADFTEDVQSFRKSLDDLRIEMDTLAVPRQTPKLTPEKLIQGILSELIICIGQLMLLRSLAGSPVNPKDYWTSDPPG